MIYVNNEENMIRDEKYDLNRILVLILLDKLKQNNFNDIKSICKLVKIINMIINEL